jgi:hypothetical protein
MRQLLKRSDRTTDVRAHRPRRRLRFSLFVFAVFVGTAVFATTAAANQPTRTQYPATSTAVLTDVCSFDVTVDSSATITETDFVNGSGELTRILLHVVEQDTFSAGGTSLTGVPFTFNIDVLFDNSGNVVHAFADGLVEKVPLPDGSLFITSGRVDFVARGNPPFILTPDVGATVNLAGFCSALSP